MPTADKFSTNGVYNGLSGCVPKVDVSGFDYWITASGYSKDDFDASTEVTQEQIDQSLHKIGLLYWNLYRVTCSTGFLSNPSSTLTEVIVSGWDAIQDPPPPPDPVQPKDRVCGGVRTRYGNTEPIDGGVDLMLFGGIDLRLDTGFARFYKGSIDDESNFIGYGLGLIAFPDGDIVAPIAQASIDAFIDPQSYLGGYCDNYTIFGFKNEYTYVVRNGIHFLWVGIISDDPDANTTTFLDSGQLKAWAEFTTGLDYQAQITGLEFWDY